MILMSYVDVSCYSMIPVHNYLPAQYLEKLTEMDFKVLK